MIDYGSAPDANELEITLFGPGYGEAIAIHLGEGSWVLIDSCIEPEIGQPASDIYLKQIGVKPNQVKAIVASHWHDDHVRGISRLAETYTKADFFLSGIFSKKSNMAFLAAYSGAASAGLARGAKELYSVMMSRKVIYPALQKTLVYDSVLNGQTVMVTALSPLSATHQQFIANMGQYIPKKGDPISHAPEVKPNLESVVLHIDLGTDAILLGADLENHPTCGWGALVADWCSRDRRKASAYKVAHHGSSTGDHPDIWSKLLKPQPVVCLTPFTKGKQPLPTDSDKIRLRGLTSDAYLTSVASRKPDMHSDQLKRLRDLGGKLAKINPGFGAVRIRKHVSASLWQTEVFGTARKL